MMGRHVETTASPADEPRLHALAYAGSPRLADAGFVPLLRCDTDRPAGPGAVPALLRRGDQRSRAAPGAGPHYRRPAGRGAAAEPGRRPYRERVPRGRQLRAN